jgi:hypothetical protein
MSDQEPSTSLATLLKATPGVDQDTFASILALIDPLSVATRVPTSTTTRPNSKYSAITHAELCRLKVLGLSDANAARAVGILPQTLARWHEEYPELEADMAQAAQLATASVAHLLFKFMEGDQPHALNAVKFWLSTRTDEFREKAEVVVSKTTSHELNVAVQGIFGITLRGAAAEGEEEEAPQAGVQAVIDVEPEVRKLPQAPPGVKLKARPVQDARPPMPPPLPDL